MSEDKIIGALRRAAERRESADRERHAASAELRRRIKDALAAGISPSRIGREARLSRQAVYEARRDERRPS